MQTRSQTKRPELPVEIDFDYASDCWNHNKIKLGPGNYKYVCGKLLKNGGFCKRNLHKNSDYCGIHKID